MGARPGGSGGAAVANQRDMADLQQLIRFVERWRMAHFQRPDSRLRDADELLRKLRRGMVMAAEGAMGQAGQAGPAWA